MQRTMRILIVLLALISSLAKDMQPAYSQNLTLEEVLAGKTVPLTLTLKDLNADWRRFSLGGQADMGSFMRLVMGAGPTSDVYYTRGQTVTIGTETYAIAYRAKIQGPDFMAMMRGGPGNMPAIQEKLTPETPIVLALLNQRTMGSLNDIRPFNLEQELAANNAAVAAGGGPRAAAANQVSTNNLKQLGMAVMMYAQDHNETLPAMKDANSMKRLLQPYTKTDTVFMHPETQEPYKINPLVSGKRLRDFPRPAETIVLVEAQPAADGTLGVLYLDGHVMRLSPEEQKRVEVEFKRIEAAEAAKRKAQEEVVEEKVK